MFVWRILFGFASWLSGVGVRLVGRCPDLRRKLYNIEAYKTG